MGDEDRNWNDDSHSYVTQNCNMTMGLRFIMPERSKLKKWNNKKSTYKKGVEKNKIMEIEKKNRRNIQEQPLRTKG